MGFETVMSRIISWTGVVWIRTNTPQPYNFSVRHVVDNAEDKEKLHLHFFLQWLYLQSMISNDMWELDWQRTAMTSEHTVMTTINNRSYRLKVDWPKQHLCTGKQWLWVISQQYTAQSELRTTSLAAVLTTRKGKLVKRLIAPSMMEIKARNGTLKAVFWWPTCCLKNYDMTEDKGAVGLWEAMPLTQHGEKQLIIT